MTIKEALKSVHFNKPYIVIDDDYKEAQQVIRDACEKQIPKKPIFVKPYGYRCPICIKHYSERDDGRGKYCACCGQRLDWGEGE